MNDELRVKNNELGEKMNYRYRTDEEMKDSGIEWVGTIPKAWNLSKFKFISELYTGNSIKDNEKDNYQDSNEAYPYIATKDIDMNYNKADYFNGMYTKINDINFRIAKKNSILLCIEGGSAGKKITYLNRNVSFVNKLCCINPSNINNKYQYYYCNSNSFLKEFNLNISGLIGGVSVGLLKNFIITKPNIVEQEKIAKFLDKKTAQFDSIISKKEALIEKLEEAKKSLISEVVTGKVKVVKTNDGYELVERKKEEMKDSGVEWLGDIPKEWLVKRIKYLLMECRGKSEEGLEEPLSMSQKYGLIKTSDMDNIPNQALSLVGNKIVCKNDLVFNKLKPHLGVFSVSKYNGIVSPDYAVYRAKEKVNIKYLEYLFKTPLYIREFKKYATGIGAGLTRLYTDQLFNIQAISPSYSEQENIVIMINRKLEETNMAIEKMKNQIEKLKEAKQSLISEAVTGKIEILD